jgi:hypothetical protein
MVADDKKLLPYRHFLADMSDRGDPATWPQLLWRTRVVDEFDRGDTMTPTTRVKAANGHWHM